MILVGDRAPLVGRTSERAAFAEALTASVQGRGTGLVLVGEAGIGKSRLLREAEDLASSQGSLVLMGRCAATGRGEPFRALREALLGGFRRTGPPAAPSVLANRNTLAHLVPAWSTRPTTGASTIAIAEALLDLLTVAAAGRGLLLAIEDLQWADDDTVAVCEYLVDNAAAHGACCVLTVRSDPDSPALRVVHELADRRAATVLDLRPLRPPEVDQLVRACLGRDAVPEGLLRFVRERAEGTPFYVEELLLGLERAGELDDGDRWRFTVPRRLETVPRTLAEAADRRLEGLSTSSRDALAAAALLGQGFDWTLVGEIIEADTDTVLAGLQEAADAQLLRGEGASIRFRHALLRDHVLATLLPPARVRLARRARRVVETRHPDLEGVWCDLAAELAELGDEPEVAATHLVTAAGRARDGGALATAITLAERAVALAEDGALASRHADRLLAELYALSGEVERALEVADRHPADTDGFELDLAIGHALVVAGRPTDARRHAARAGQRASADGDERGTLRSRLLLAEVVLAENQDLDEVGELVEPVLEAPRLPPELRCAALELLGRRARPHDVAEAERCFAAALATAEEHGLALWRARAANELGTIDLLDRMRLDRLEAARTAATEAGAPATAAVATFHLAAALIARGQTGRGREAAVEAEALARRLGLAVAPWATLLVARADAQERRTVETEAAVARALAGSDDPALHATAWGHVRAMLALHQADRDGALAALDRAAVLLRQAPAHHDPHRGLWALCRTLAGVDDATARAEAAAAAGSDTRFNRALLAVADAVVAGRAGDVAAATARCEAGIAILGGYEGPDLLRHLTSWLVAPEALSRGWGAPVEQLQAAVRWFAAQGQEPLATSCRTLLRAAGAAVPRRGRGESTVPERLQPLGVTSREVDVLWLLGERFTNAAIAERLVLSPRTVEKHVASLLRKTGRADRGGLASLASELRGVGTDV
jgi:DNA-binding CsgD family transcriptional regulator/tetratricopeptide (TPR) repeat protein